MIDIEVNSVYEYLCPLTLVSAHSLIPLADCYFGVENLLLSC